jgi:hypothetical protein
MGVAFVTWLFVVAMPTCMLIGVIVGQKYANRFSHMRKLHSKAADYDEIMRDYHWVSLKNGRRLMPKQVTTSRTPRGRGAASPNVWLKMGLDPTEGDIFSHPDGSKTIWLGGTWQKYLLIEETVDA